MGIFHPHRPESPTEHQMRRTALFTNSNKSFENYFAEMRRRTSSRGITINHLGQRFILPTNDNYGVTGDVSESQSPMLPIQRQQSMNSSSIDRTPIRLLNATMDREPFELESRPELRKLEVNPKPRDGHAAVIMFNSLWVFGGDRHRVPFNDLMILPLSNLI